jgi:hypothetical protein
MVVRIVLALLLLAVACGSASADNAASHKVDCDRLSFHFARADDADEANCFKFSYSEPSGDGSGSWAEVYEHMLVYIGEEVVRITAGRSVEHVYFARRALRSYIDDFDELTQVENWSTEDDYDDYQLARFAAKFDGDPVMCFGFLTWGSNVVDVRGSAAGPGSFMVGYDCQFGSDAQPRNLIEQTLAAIK